MQCEIYSQVINEAAGKKTASSVLRYDTAASADSSVHCLSQNWRDQQ
jgi:hypothetical protein